MGNTRKVKSRASGRQKNIYKKTRSAGQTGASTRTGRNVGEKNQTSKKSYPARRTSAHRKKGRRRKQSGGKNPWFRYLIFLVIAVVCVIAISNCAGKRREAARQMQSESGRPAMDVELLTVNPYSRPGIELKKVKGVVVHYTANPGSTAKQNRDYFEGLKDSHTTKASAHFVIGLDGEIVQCIPTAEMAYASNNRNSDTIAIECCHPNEDGKFTQATYDSLVELTAWLCQKFNLTSDDVIRHYDVTGKLCPLYFVKHEDAWKQFKKDVDAAIRA